VTRNGQFWGAKAVDFEAKTPFRAAFHRARAPARSIFLQRRDFSVFFWAL
jgi:hypothetical protein